MLAMRDIARRFSNQMDKICGYIDLILEVISLAKVSQKGLRSKHDFVLNASKVTDSVQKIGNFTITVYDGVYLTACADYELVIRELIEAYMQCAVQKCRLYHHLPQEIREWYPEGCARILLNLDQDKFRHLTKDHIMHSISSCINPSKSKGYSILGEAFSDNERNFWPSEIESYFKRIGIEKIWQKLSRESNIQDALGTRNDMATEQRAKSKLNELLQRRNDIIHRGKTYYTPSESEVRDCATFFKILIINLAEVMESQIAAI
jgi:hypothetical protein